MEVRAQTWTMGWMLSLVRVNDGRPLGATHKWLSNFVNSLAKSNRANAVPLAKESETLLFVSILILLFITNVFEYTDEFQLPKLLYTVFNSFMILTRNYFYFRCQW